MVADLAAEMQLRAPGIERTIGSTIGGGVAGGGAIGYFGLSSVQSFYCQAIWPRYHKTRIITSH